MAIGYLLARATDTVADTHTLPLAERQHLLDLLSKTLNQDPPNVETTRECARLTHHFAQQQTHPHERALMLALPECWPLLQALSKDDRAVCVWCWGTSRMAKQLGHERDLARS